MKTTYIDAISHTNTAKLGENSRTLLRVPQHFKCKSNLRVLGINVQIKNTDDTALKTQVKWLNRGGIWSCVDQITLRSSNGEEIDVIRNVGAYCDNIWGVKNSNSYHRDFLTVLTGCPTGYKLNEETALLTTANNFDSPLIEQQEYTLNLDSMIDYLKKVQYISDGIEIEILWTNPFLNAAGVTPIYNLYIPQNPVLAIDEVFENVSSPSTVVFEQVWSDIVQISGSPQNTLAQVQNVQQRLKSCEGYFVSKLALCVYDQTTNKPSQQLGQIVNFYNDGEIVVQLRGIESINSCSVLKDCLGGVELNLPRVQYLNKSVSEALNSSSQLQDPSEMGSAVNVMGLPLNKRLNEFLLDYTRLWEGATLSETQTPLNVYIFFWVVREASHDGVSTSVRYL